MVLFSALSKFSLLFVLDIKRQCVNALKSEFLRWITAVFG